MKTVRYTLRSNIGRFELVITPNVNRNTGQANTLTLNLGTKQKKCVQLTIPTMESGNMDAKLLWVEAHEECSMETHLKNGLASQMVIVVISVARALNKNLQRIYLDDTSSFKCDLPNSKFYQVPLKIFNIAFHGATWYEQHFDAVLEKDHELYEKSKMNRHKRECKPKEFDFINKELQEELDPLYHNTATWHDFFEVIATKYNRQKCAVVYPWITTAVETMLQGSWYQSAKWYIDLKENEKKNKTRSVPFTIQQIVGGKRQTQKKRHARRYTSSRTYIFPNIPEIQSWNYRDFLTRK